jgi:hypothetical protein
MIVQTLHGGGEMANPGVARAAHQFATVGRGMILLGAFVSFVLPVSLWFTGNHEQGIFVGLWVPSILILGALAAGRDEHPIYGATLHSRYQADERSWK